MRSTQNYYISSPSVKPNPRVYYIQLLFFLCFFVQTTLSCGGAVHNEVAERARLLLAGATFPDWGYGCFGNDDDAEVSHWTPFLLASIQHIKEKFTVPYDDHAK
ncbi:hypothetical protein BB560_006915, partial [Smittium megazygosporum]